jgi:predicted nucleic acid-binding protein
VSVGLVVDASVAAKWLFQEPDQDLALSLIGRFELIAPELLLVECGNLIWRRQRLGEVAAQVAPRMVGKLRAGPIRFYGCSGLVERAVVLAVALRHTIYDCIYMSLALAQQARVVTCDRRFAAAVRADGGLAPRVVLLSELAS